jgi:hypothetical protein
MGRSRHPCRSPTPDQFARNSSASPTDAWERVRCGRRHAGSGDGRVGSPLRKASLLSTSSPSSPSRSFADRQHLPWKLAFSVSCSWIQRHLNRDLRPFICSFSFYVCAQGFFRKCWLMFLFRSVTAEFLLCPDACLHLEDLWLSGDQVRVYTARKNSKIVKVAFFLFLIKSNV